MDDLLTRDFILGFLLSIIFCCVIGISYCLGCMDRKEKK